MWFYRVLIFSTSILFVASKVVNCSEEGTYVRRKIGLLFKKSQSVTLMVSVDEKSMENTEPHKLLDERFTKMQNLIIKNVSVPITLCHKNYNTSKETFESHGMVRGGFMVSGTFKIKAIFKNFMNHKEVRVYYREDEEKTNKFHLFEGCHMESDGYENIQVEKTSVLLLDSLANQSGSFLQELKMKNEAVKMVNFSIHGFEIEGPDVCDHVEFYMNGCVERPKFNYNNLILIIIPFVAYAIIICLCIEKCFTKFRSNRVVPLTTFTRSD